MTIIHKLLKEQKIAPPPFLADNLHFLTIMGSKAYGASLGESSDIDVYGWCIPRKEDVFPHLRNEIQGFGIQKQRFEVWQEHHVKSEDKEYDFCVYSIVKYFQLVMENNPNMLDSLFVPRHCIIHSTKIAEVVRENRNMFLHKGSFPKMKGYAYGQLQKIKNQKTTGSKRHDLVEELGWDSKAAYHVARLIMQAEQILTEHTLDLDRNAEQLKAIRRGEWTFDRLVDFFATKEKVLEEVYTTSTLRAKPDEDAIKALLLRCLEEHYGDISNAIKSDVRVEVLLSDLRELLARHGG